MSGKRKRSFAIKPEGLALIQTRVTEKGYSHEKFAEVAGLSPDTIGNIFRGHNPERKTIEAIAQALKLEPTDIVDANEWYPKSLTTAKEHTDIDWRLVSQASQKLRRKATEMGFEVNVDVPLGLVERKQQQRRGEKVERQVYELEKEVITKIYEHKEFLQQVIGQSQGRKNKHIAIVGEPGAGKTTLLSKIANFIKTETEDLAICISLASLQGRTLQEYLLKTWLSEAMGLVYPEVVITPEIENQLITRFRKSGVWLLLDGVDEMGASSPVQALTKINRELTDWLAEARVVLTCRLNVWDANVNNTLSGFDTFKTQEFQPEQIGEFIQEWFIRAEKPQRGEELQAKLKETRHERICELVTNPLRLALLCQTFYLDKQGDLPATKAALYQRFTRYFYEWKAELIPTDLINSDELKDELHQALGKLALVGINSDARFRLKESLARREMGEKLFKLACDVGWLNLIDRDADTDEPVYAFFHPNFQEYFAALVVKDWHYFLHHNNENPNPFIKYNNKDCVYRIFEPQWRQVILLWLGREDVKKEQFIDALVTFRDGCGDENFYWYQAYCFAAEGIAEFVNCQKANEIVTQIINWSFGCVNIQQQRWVIFRTPIQDRARITLQQTNRQMIIDGLILLLDNSQYKGEARHKIIEIISEIGNGNYKVINALNHIIKNQGHENKCCVEKAACALVKIAFGKLKITAINILIDLLPSLDAVIRLSKIDFNDLDTTILDVVIAALTKHLKQTFMFDFKRTLIAEALRKIAPSDHPSHQYAIDVLTEQLRFSYSTIEATISAQYLKDAGFSNSEEVNTVLKESQNAFDDHLTSRLADLGLKRNLEVINTVKALINLMCSDEERQTREQAAWCLEVIILNKQFASESNLFPSVVNSLKTGLVKLLDRNDRRFYKFSFGVKDPLDSCYAVIWHCAQNMTYPDFYHAWNPEPSLENQFTNTTLQLQPTNKTHPIIINAQALQHETDTSAIAQEICNQIYLTAFPDNPEIPEVNNAPQLKRILPQIKKQLQTKNLALIINNCELNQALITFCCKLTDVLHIAWITDQPLEPPPRGFPPNQPNLLSAIQTWINEIE